MLLLATLLASCVGSARRASVDPLDNGCKLIELPFEFQAPPGIARKKSDVETWRDAGALLDVRWSNRDFRASGKDSDELYLGLWSTEADTRKIFYSVDKYAFRLSGSAGTRKLSEQEWERAGKLDVPELRGSGLVNVSKEYPIESLAMFRGKKLQKAGQHWPFGHFGSRSPDSKWMAIFSYDGKPPDPSRATESFWGHADPEPLRSKFYVEIYDMSVVERRMSITGNTGRYSPGRVFAQIDWVGDDYVILPLPEDREDTAKGDKQQMVVCRLPRPIAPPPASIRSFADHAVDNNKNGLTDRIVNTVTVDVRRAGNYAFSMELQGSNGKIYPLGATETLSAGTQQIAVSISGFDLADRLGVNGPYRRKKARLVRTDEAVIPDYHADAGDTSAYSLSSFDRRTLYLTDKNSATGISANGRAGFEILRIRIGVASPAADCNYSAVLRNASSNKTIDSVDGMVSLSSSATSIALDFRGPKIARSLQDGPYRVEDFSLSCGAERIDLSDLWETQSFTASQFENIPPDFSLWTPASTITATPGESPSFQINLTSIGGFGDNVTFTFSGAPRGSTTDGVRPNIVSEGGLAYLQITLANGTAPGAYPLVVTGTSGSISHRLVLNLVVSAGKTQ